MASCEMSNTKAPVARPWIGITVKAGVIGLFLIILAITANYFASILPCQLSKKLETSQYIRLLFLLFIIFIAVTQMAGTSISPAVALLVSVGVWVGVMLYMKTTLGWSIIILGLFIALYVAELQFSFMIENAEDDATAAQLLQLETRVRVVIIILIGLALAAGAVVYTAKQMQDKGASFEWSTSLFATRKCETLA